MRLRLLCLLLATSSLILGCSTAPQPTGQAQPTTASSKADDAQARADTAFITSMLAAPDSEAMVAAKRFLNSFGAGQLAMQSLKDAMKQEAAANPSIAELAMRALSSIDADDFENLAARVYSRHISSEHMLALVQFTDTDTGGRFMRASIDHALSGQKGDTSQLMNQFSADELLQIMKFAQSDAFTAMQAVLPTINAELAQESEKLGQAVMRDYIRQQ